MSNAYERAPWWTEIVGPASKRLEQMQSSRTGVQGVCAALGIDPAVLDTIVSGRGNELSAAEVAKAEVAFRWTAGMMMGRPTNPRPMEGPMNPDWSQIHPDARWTDFHDYVRAKVAEVNAAFPPDGGLPTIGIDLIVRTTMDDPNAREISLAAVEELLRIAEPFRESDSALAAHERLSLDAACLSLAPQIRSPDPNASAIVSLFGQIVGLLFAHLGHVDRFTSFVLTEAAQLVSSDHAARDAHASRIFAAAVTQSKLEVEWLGDDEIVAGTSDSGVDDAETDSDQISQSYYREAVERARAGLRNRRPDFMAKLERQAGDLFMDSTGIAGRNLGSAATGLVAWLYTQNVAGGLVAVVVRFVIGIYRVRQRSSTRS